MCNSAPLRGKLGNYVDGRESVNDLEPTHTHTCVYVCMHVWMYVTFKDTTIFRLQYEGVNEQLFPC